MVNLLALGYFHSVPEVRSLPSAGITRLQRYYGPLRLPKRPSLSLAGVRLAHAATTWGLPCCVDSPCTDMPAPLPRRDRRWDQVTPLTATTAAFPMCPQGRLPHQVFRGLLGVHSRSGLPARGVAKRPFPSKAPVALLPPPPLRLLLAGATLARWELHPLKNDTFARRTDTILNSYSFASARV